MSAFTTRRMTRDRAKRIIEEAISDTQTTDEMIEDICDLLLKKSLYNVRIIPDYARHDGEDHVEE